MATRWRLKKYLANDHGIYSVRILQEVIAKKTGVLVSYSNLCRYVNEKPKSIRLEILELLCSALQCQLNQILEIIPKDYKRKREAPKKLAIQHTPHKKRNIKFFPNPVDYEA